MPERPKRRKNKNKRKNNKNNGTDVNKNNVSENTDSVVEPSSGFVEKITEDKLNEVNKGTSDLPSTSKLINICVSSKVTQVFEKTDEGNVVVINSNKVFCNENQIIADDDGKAFEETEEINKEISMQQSCDVSNNICTDDTKISKESKEKDVRKVADYLLGYSDGKKTEDEVSVVDINFDRISKNGEESLTEDQNKQKSNEITNLPEQILENEDAINIPPKNSEQSGSQPYIVEIPEQSTKIKCKLNNNKKSKSCDDDDSPTIVEITDEPNVNCDDDNALSIIDSSNMIITGDDSDIEWENVDHFNLTQAETMMGVLSSDTIPLNIVHCEQTKSLSPEDEKSLRNFLQTLNLSSNPSNLHSDDIKSEIEQIINREIKYRLRKKAMAEDNLFYRAGTSRSLAVIDEEGSGDSSKTSRRHSYLSDKKSDNEELEDEVFEKTQTKSIDTKTSNSSKNTSDRRLIPQPCIRVDAKLKEPDIIEARGDWSMQTIEKLSGAELVYLTDSSSSTSSIYDVNDDVDKGEETDVSIRMITPTIEVTDTESLLSNTFLKNNIDSNIKTDNNIQIIIDDKKQLSDNEELNDQSLNTYPQNNSHEIIVLSTDNIKTNLFVKDVSEAITDKEIERSSQNKCDEDNKNVTTLAKSSKSPEDIDKYDLEIKVLKCELNDAINNLIKEVISDSENTSEIRGTFTRQDSSSSVDSSQCTAKYNPTHSSLNDVSNIIHDGIDDNLDKKILQISADSSHVKDVLHCVTANTSDVEEKVNQICNQPSKLKDICLEKITSFPYGHKILEELANVSERLQKMSVIASERNQSAKRKISSTKLEQGNTQLQLKTTEYETLRNRENPPPVLPRKSSLKLAQEEHQKIIPKSEIVYECLSPSQKMLMETTNTLIQKEDFKSQPNLNSSRINSESYDDKIWNKNNSTTSIVPMKSETGSRLLAFLRDKPLSNNNNLKSSDTKHSYISSKDEPSPSESFSKRLLNEIDSPTHNRGTRNEEKASSIHFKPIPPPKPKNITSYFYESDDSSNLRDNSFRSMKSNKKIFHYSTGNLSKEIEHDVSSIQNMHRHCMNSKERFELRPRRPSLPKDLCDQQMEYIRQKEKEVDAELRRLEQQNNTFCRRRGPKAPMFFEDEITDCTYKSNSRNYVTKDYASNRQLTKNLESSKVSSLFSSSQEELLREKMYTEYVSQMAEREQRKQQKIIKVTRTSGNGSTYSRSMPVLDKFDSKINNPIEQEFISKAKERWYKLGIRDPETEDERNNENSVYKEPKVIEHKVKVIEAGEEKDVQRLPSHIQDFVKFTVSDKDRESSSPGESDAEQAPAHVVVFCAVVILVLTVGKFLLRLLRHK